jgi:hypothetical protein
MHQLDEALSLIINSCEVAKRSVQDSAEINFNGTCLWMQALREYGTERKCTFGCLIPYLMEQSITGGQTERCPQFKTSLPSILPQPEPDAEAQIKQGRFSTQNDQECTRLWYEVT